MSNDHLRVRACRVEDFKRVRAVELQPGERGVFVIQGNNAQGKTSILDALSWGFGGRYERPEQAVREGADQAVVTIELDGEVDGRPESLTLTRRFPGRRGGEELEIRTADGRRWPSAQALLDRLVSRKTIDPIRFMSAHPKEQRSMLLEAVGLGDELNQLEMRRQDIYDERRSVHRLKRDAEGEAERIGDPGVIPEAVDVEDLLQQRAEVRTVEQRRADLLDRAREQRRISEDFRGQARDHAAEVERIDAEIARLKQRRGQVEKLHHRRIRQAAGAAEAADGFQAEADAVQVPDTWALDDQIATAREQNERRQRALDHARRYHAASEQLARHTTAYREMTEQLDELERRKVEALQQAASDVPGLGIDGDVLTIDGQPLSQASTAQQMRLCMTVAARLRPGLRMVWCDRAESLDDEQLTSLAAWARDRDLVVVLSRVGVSDAQAVTIVDGEVAP